ncbi:pilus assembly protein PilP [Panacagrimonas sp.]|uniref:pilus assembly protein PilP n=1 Tax=Panacagrimonas sp. TaxID=2480088 RepID=UPI003B515E82
MRRSPTKYLLPGVVLTLTACSSGMEDLEQRVAEVKSRKSQQIEPIPQIKQFESFTYEPADRRDPFQQAQPDAEAQVGGGPRPDMDRSREPLEDFPLDALRMQGIIETNKAVFALVKAPDGVIHRVSVGNHMGQNYGEIKAIAESEITLAEIIPDGFGGWISRPATLALAE